MGRMECLSLPASLQKCKRISAWLSSLLLGIYHISAPGRLCLLKYRLSSQILIYPKQAKLGSCLSPPLSLQNSKQSVRWLSSLSLVIYQLRGIPLLKSLNCNLDFSDPQIRFLTPHVNLWASKIADQAAYVSFSLCPSIYQLWPSFCSNTSTLRPFKYPKLWGYVSCLSLCLQVSKIGLEDTDERLHFGLSACEHSKVQSTEECSLYSAPGSWVYISFFVACSNIQKKSYIYHVCFWAPSAQNRTLKTICSFVCV